MKFTVRSDSFCRICDGSAGSPELYLCFSQEPNAEEAGEQLRSRGFSVEVRKGASGEDWLTLATKASPKTGVQMNELRHQVEALAAQFGGEYDGWEAAIDSLPSQSVDDDHKLN